MTDTTAFVLFALLLLGAVGVGEALRAWAAWRPESSRRVVHGLVGVMVVACVPLFDRPGLIYILAVLFAAVNLFAVPMRIFPGMHGVARQTWGTVTFPLALVVALYLCWTLDAERIFVLQAAFLALALADPAASLAGSRLARPRPYDIGRHEKSVAGSAAFFAVALVAVAGTLLAVGPAEWSPGTVLAAALTAAVLATVGEALGVEGWDNLFIVLAVIVPLAALHAAPEAAVRFVLALALAGAFGVVAFRARFLDLSGALAAGLLAWTVVALGGLAWAVPGFSFFFLSSLLSRWGKARKEEATRLAEKSDRRDAGQVLANGGVAGALLVATIFWPHPALYWGFAGAFAAASADTWGTEVGTYFRWPTRSVATGRRVPPGTSGGLSVPGTLGALAGAAVIALSAIPFAGFYLDGFGMSRVVLVVIGSGFVAALLDSFLGATVQARYRDSSGTLTERAEVDGAALPLARGLRFVGNDRVNLACTAAGGLAAFLATM